MNCPRCHGLLEKPNYCTDCGWVKPSSPKPTPAGPDHARIAAEREQSIARASEPVPTRKLACQSVLCAPTTRALPERDLCQACAELEASGREVRRVRRPSWMRSAGELVSEARGIERAASP